MDETSSQSHWQKTYSEKGEAGVSWFEDRPAVSLDLIGRTGANAASSLIDVGGGASRLVDALLGHGWHALAVLDVSQTALDAAKARLGGAADAVEWIVADVTRWRPARTYDVWHDRAAFHFLTEPDERAAYVERLAAAVKPGGHAVIATFAADGPERCSGLPVMRYEPAALAATVGSSFRLVDERRHVHTTPWGTKQAFQFSVLRRCGP
ncbi:class I SAM-dependent methyltransferase [Kumtagia ephedrae]|uniref:SAM-dependent methyltransferase n=1 Tax=Kumtagia ephedrae TaxID=2116701 RepID=A0A2P7RU28_9HYPH|nr:class I SAM-dependent methyltransferase [Mesorhizobium ephedrae]PSJ53714.1 SAM-dependent methyltransferase [Mesorhizobium ephedrae]